MSIPFLHGKDFIFSYIYSLFLIFFLTSAFLFFIITSVEHLNEAWLSLVERCVRDAEVACSNHVASTGYKNTGKPDHRFPVFFCSQDFLQLEKGSYPSAFLRRVRSLLFFLCAYFSSSHFLSDIQDMVADTFKVCKHF